MEQDIVHEYTPTPEDLTEAQDPMGPDEVPLDQPPVPTDPAIETTPEVEEPEAPVNPDPLYLEMGGGLGLDDEVPASPDLYTEAAEPTEAEWGTLPEDPLNVIEDPENEGEEAEATPEESFLTEEHTTAEDSSTTLKEYEVEGRESPTASWQHLARVPASDLEAEILGLPAGEQWEVRVRGHLEGGATTDWSAPAQVTLPVDLLAPDVPSRPIASGGFAGVTVKWDGLAATAGPMPADFSHLVIWHSETGATGTWNRKHSLIGPDEVLITDLEAGKAHYFAFTAVDETGNESGMSAVASATVERLVDAEGIAEALAESKAVLGQVKASLAALYGTEPPAEPSTEGRIYFQVDANGDPIAAFRFEGSSWVGIPLEEAVFIKVTTDQIIAGSGLIGGALIENNTLTVAHLNITAEMVAELLRAKKVEADEIDVNTLWASQAFLGAARASQLALESVNSGLRTLVSGAGLRVYQRHTEDDGTVIESPLVTVGGDSPSTFAVHDLSTGVPLASIGADGSMVAQTFDTATDPTVQGTPIVGAIAHRHDSGDYASAYLDGMPWGRLSYHSRNDHWLTHQGGELGILEVQVWAQPGRTYEIRAETGGLVGNGGIYRGVLRRRVGSSVFTSNSFKQAQTNWSGAGQHSIVLFGTTEGPSDLDADPIDYRFLLSVQNTSGIEWVDDEWAKKAWIAVYDVGPRRGSTGTKRSTRLAATGEVDTTEPTPAPPVTTRTSKWSGTAMRSYYKGGSAIQTSGAGSTMLRQGSDPYWPGGGLQASMFLLPKATIRNTLSGSTVSKASLTLRSAYNPGGTSKRVRLYWHGLTALADTYPSAINLVGEYVIAEGATLSIPLPASVRTALANGQVGGFSFSTNGDTASRYALGLSWSTRPQLSVTYTK